MGISLPGRRKLVMPIPYYTICYADSTYERVWREEDMLACKLGNKKIKSIKYYKYTVSGWKVRIIVWVETKHLWACYYL